MNLCNLLRIYAGKPPLDENGLPKEGINIDEAREAFDERAAIIEHNGGLSRIEAEKQVKEIVEKSKRDCS